jgi:hypothetical protein
MIGLLSLRSPDMAHSVPIWLAADVIDMLRGFDRLCIPMLRLAYLIHSGMTQSGCAC